MTDPDPTERIYFPGAVVGTTASGLHRRTIEPVTAFRTQRQRRLDDEVDRILNEVYVQWARVPNHPPATTRRHAAARRSAGRRRWWPGR